MRQQKKRGFTLIEVIVVLAIGAILAGVAIPLAFNGNNAVTARACQSSRDSLYTTFIMNQKLNGGTDILADYLAAYQEALRKGEITSGNEDYVLPCPQNGIFSAVEDNSAIRCSIHSGKADDAWLFDYKEKARELMDLKDAPVGTTVTVNGASFTYIGNNKIKDVAGKTYNMNASPNTNVIEMLYAAYGGVWPTLEIPKGDTNGFKRPLVLIPYTGIDDVTKESCSIVFASRNTTSFNGGWNATLVYFPDEKKWYVNDKGVNGGASIAGWNNKNYDEMRADALSRGWTELVGFNPPKSTK